MRNNSGMEIIVAILIASPILLQAVPLQQPADPPRFAGHIDFDKRYPKPTITAMAPFILLAGRKPRLYIQIQEHAIQYTCSPIDKSRFEKQGFKVGDIVEIQQASGILSIRHPAGRWTKLKLLQKTRLFNL